MLKHLAYFGIASLFSLAANGSCLAQNSARRSLPIEVSDVPCR